MKDDIYYREPDCGAHVPHEGVCSLCGAEPRWVVPVERCKHGNIDPHIVMLPKFYGCPGAALGGNE